MQKSLRSGLFWNGVAFLFRLLSERQGASGCIFCSGASDRRAGTMCLSPSGRYSQKISTGKYAPLTPSNFPCCACLAESDSGKWTISPTRFRLAILARDTARCLLCVYRLFPFLPLRSREMDGLFLSGTGVPGTATCAMAWPTLFVGLDLRWLYLLTIARRTSRGDIRRSRRLWARGALYTCAGALDRHARTLYASPSDRWPHYFRT